MIEITSQIISTVNDFVRIGIIEKLANLTVRATENTPKSAAFVVAKVSVVPEMVRKE